MDSTPVPLALPVTILLEVSRARQVTVIPLAPMTLVSVTRPTLVSTLIVSVELATLLPLAAMARLEAMARLAAA